MSFLESVFILSSAAVFFTYAGYPILLWLLVRFKSAQPEPAFDETAAPTISIIIPARNEVSGIVANLYNTFDLEYPPSLIEILVIDDASEDSTGLKARQVIQKSARARNFRSTRVIRKNHAQGKAAALNLAMQEARGEVLFFTDADCRLESVALKRLVAVLQTDSRVGCVAGRYLSIPQETGKRSATDLYWKYEDFIRRAESKMGGLLGASGALFVVRKEAAKPLPIGLINDDFVIPMRTLLDGWKTVYAPEATAREVRDIQGQDDDFRRRVRIMTGNWQHLWLFWRLLPTASNRIVPALQMFCHKFLRVLSPFVLATVLCLNILLFLLKCGPLCSILLLAQLGFYGLAMAGFMPIISKAPLLGNVARAARFFVLLNYTAALGMLEFMKGANRVAWSSSEQGKPETHS